MPELLLHELVKQTPRTIIFDAFIGSTTTGSACAKLALQLRLNY
jgi:hypothetical protein